MRDSVFLKALNIYLDGSLLLDTEKCTVHYALVSCKAGIFGRSLRYKVRVSVYFHTSELNFLEIALLVKKAIEKQSEAKIAKIDASWFICSGQGGVYMYEALATKEHGKIKNMHNRFVVLNSLSGAVSFGPGHISNSQMTQKLQDLLEQLSTTPLEKWVRAMCSFFSLCETVRMR